MSSNIYEPLPTNHHIRVLRFEKVEWEEKAAPVICSLHLLDLDDEAHEPYMALSYTWGDPFQRSNDASEDELTAAREYELASHDITCNGATVQVRRNLFQAIHRLRTFSDADLWWIDALSIHQSDIEERKKQVAIMGSIFYNAKIVVYWLGEADLHSSIALPLLERFGEADEMKMKALDIRDADALMRELDKMNDGQGLRLPFNEPKFFMWLGIPQFSISDWVSIAMLLRRSLFLRAWAFPELCLGHRSVVFCGRDGCAIRCLREFAAYMYTMDWPPAFRHLSGLPRASNAGLAALSDMASLLLWDPSYRPWVQQQLVRIYGNEAVARNIALTLTAYLVEESRSREATDLRDKIFAPLSYGLFCAPFFSSDSDQVSFMPDYSKSLQDVFVQFTKRVIEGTGSLALLSQTEEIRTGPGLVALPSWVPNYSVAATRRESALSRQPKGRQFQNRDWRTKDDTYWDACSKELLRPPVVIGGRFLDISGFLLTRVTGKLPAYYTDDGYDFLSLARASREAFADRPEVDWLLELAHTLTCVAAPDVPHTFQHDFSYWLITEYVFSCGRKSADWDSVQQELNGLLMTQRSFPGQEIIAARMEEMTEAARTLTSIELLAKSSFMNRYAEGNPYSAALQECCRQRKFISTTNGTIGLAPLRVQEGDEIWLIPGLRAPFVLRPVSSGNYLVIGEAYIHNYMMGEAFADGEIGSESIKDIRLE